MQTEGSILERPVIEQTKPGGNGKLAHIVYPADKLTEAYVLGTPVEALCGYTWTPDRDPMNYPLCSKCKDVYDHLHPEDNNRDWHGEL